jgi:hypothetical protein
MATLTVPLFTKSVSQSHDILLTRKSTRAWTEKETIKMFVACRRYLEKLGYAHLPSSLAMCDWNAICASIEPEIYRSAEACLRRTRTIRSKWV